MNDFATKNYQSTHTQVGSNLWSYMIFSTTTSPGGNTPQSTNYTATCLPSRKQFKLDEPDRQETAGEAETSS